MSRFFKGKGKGKASRTEDFTTVRGFGRIPEPSSSHKSRQIPPPGPPDSPPNSPRVTEADFSDDDSIGMGSMGGDSFEPSHPRSSKSAPKERELQQYAVVKEEVFNTLAYCGFLDIKQAFLYRWAVGVAWDMQVYRQTRCNGTHSSPTLPPTPPPVLYRLFAANAILPHSIRASATTRVLIVLHALFYMSKIPSCPFCAEQQDMIDLSSESRRMFSGVDDAVISKCVIEWAGAMKCALGSLVDVPGPNYWEKHTAHIADKVGEDITASLQHYLDNKFGISDDHLIAIMNAITDDYPLSLTPTSMRRYCGPPGLHSLSNWHMISTH